MCLSESPQAGLDRFCPIVAEATGPPQAGVCVAEIVLIDSVKRMQGISITFVEHFSAQKPDFYSKRCSPT